MSSMGGSRYFLATIDHEYYQQINTYRKDVMQDFSWSLRNFNMCHRALARAYCRPFNG